MANTKYNPVAWFEIYVQDLEKAKKFYGEVFDCKFEDLKNPDGD